MEKELGITEARQDFSGVLEEVQYRGQSFVINRRGKPVAAVVPLEVYESWKRRRKKFFDAIREIQAANKEADPEQVMKKVVEAQQAVRSSDNS